MDWRSDKDLLHDIMMNALPPGQMLYKKDRDAAIKDDQENKRGHLILNPDLDTAGLDVEGMIIGRPGEEHEGDEYRVVVDPAMKGMKDQETGEMKAGFWLKHQPILPILPMVPFKMHDITERLNREHAMMKKVAVDLEPYAYPSMKLFDMGEDEYTEDAGLAKAYEAWLKYYREMEAIDRLHQHNSGHDGRKEVIPTGTSKAKKKAYDIQKATVDQACLGISASTKRAGQTAASNDFDKELTWCECSVCKEARDGQ
jgi:hypothetical protein